MSQLNITIMDWQLEVGGRDDDERPVLERE